MFIFVLGYMGAAAGFYYLIAKTAKVEPEILAVANRSVRLGRVLELADQSEKRAA
jgi:hypothetical protein